MSSATDADDRKPAAKAPQPSIESGTPDDDQEDVRPPPDGTPEQLEEFNQWLTRWQSYQTELSNYWQRRYSAIYGAKLAKLSSKPKRKYEPANTTADFKWNLRYQELLDFRAEHGTVHVPKAFEYQYTAPGLGVWASKQKELKTKEKLNDSEAAKKSKLDLIGFFKEEPKDKLKFTMAWHSLYLALKEFRDLNGHVEIPQGYKPMPGTGMGTLDGWLKRQRDHFKHGRMPAHLRDKFTAVGVNLLAKGRPFGARTDEDFKDKYEKLVAYSLENGDCDVPKNYRKNPVLARFVQELREHYSQGILPQKRIVLLQDIGFNFFYGRKDSKCLTLDPWERKISELKAYKSKTGHTNVPRNFSLNLALGDFVFNQREAKKNDMLSNPKIKELNELGFSWLKPVRPPKKASHASNWEGNFLALQAYMTKHGHDDFGRTMESTSKTGRWVHRQRVAYKAGNLDQEKIDKLKSVGFTFDQGNLKSDAKPWTEQYEELKQYKEANGDCCVPPQYEPNPSLYYWLGTQRSTFKKGKMSDERIALLKELDFNFSTKPRTRNTATLKDGKKPFLDESEWQKMYKEMEVVKEKTGKADAHQRSGPLGTWVHYNRFYRKNGKLPEEKIALLDKLGFVWNKNDEQWNVRYQKLIDYKNKNGNFDIPSNHELYSWVMYQRRQFKSGTLPDDKVSLLIDIRFDFDTITDAKRRGSFHGTPSSKSKSKKPRLESPATMLGVLKVPQVESAPIDREQYLEDMWEKSLTDLQAYKAEEGNTDVPISYPSLGAWVFSQKMAYKKGKLSEEKVEKLTHIGFNFGGKEKASAAAGGSDEGKRMDV